MVEIRVRPHKSRRDAMPTLATTAARGLPGLSLASAVPVGETGWTVSTRAFSVSMEGNRLRRTRSDVFPLVGVVAAAVLILIGRTQRITPVAIAGYTLLALSGGLYLYLRSRKTP